MRWETGSSIVFIVRLIFVVNCADVRINGQKSAGRISGKPMSIANFAGFPTIQPAGGSGGPGNSRITHEEINA